MDDLEKTEKDEIEVVKTRENKRLNKYLDEFNRDTKLTLTNIREKSLLCSQLRSKWLNYYKVEQENLEKSTELRRNALNKKLPQGQSSSVLRLKSEEKLLKEDNDLKQITDYIDNTKSCIDYIERAMNIMDDFGFTIKNTIEIFKLDLKG